MKLAVLSFPALTCITIACGSTAPLPAPRPVATWKVADTTPATAASFVRVDEHPSLRAFAIPAADTAAFPARANLGKADFLVLKLFDEHSPATGPGPIATALTVRRILGTRLADVGASKIVAGLPNYGYLWRTNRQTQRITFDEARRAAAQANVELVRDPASGSLHAVQPGNWELWVVDDELLRALMAEATSLGVERIALFVKR